MASPKEQRLGAIAVLLVMMMCKPVLSQDVECRLKPDEAGNLKYVCEVDEALPILNVIANNSSAMPSSAPTATKRKTVPQLQYLGEPVDIQTPLDNCQGDCDNDWDCGYALNCFHRRATEPVPGCGRSGIRAVDYCYIPPPGELVIVGENSTSNAVYPFGQCQGQCQNDSDCLPGLSCFLRDNFEGIPGCTGTGAQGTNYCYLQLPSDQPSSLPSDQPSDLISSEPSSTETSAKPSSEMSMSPSTNVFVEAESTRFKFAGLPPHSALLARCEGHCSADTDCELGLVCQQRVSFGKESGCSGIPLIGVRYCVEPQEGQLRLIGNEKDALHFPFGNCEGSCRCSLDCRAGLECFRRDNVENVPGCSGIGAPGLNYCYKPSDSDIELNESEEKTKAPVATRGPLETESDSPSEVPSDLPTLEYSDRPSKSPSLRQTASPSSFDGTEFENYSDTPSATPSVATLSNLPSIQPSSDPTTEGVSSSPSYSPSVGPISTEASVSPSTVLSKEIPTNVPTMVPSNQQSLDPTIRATSLAPSDNPSVLPSASSSRAPTILPSSQPTEAISSPPSVMPIDFPSLSPSSATSARPTGEPSSSPIALSSSSPTTQVSDVPSLSPSSTTSARPSDEPSSSPVTLPSRSPTTLASDIPSLSPSSATSARPTGEPSSSPIALSSSSPTTQVSDVPSLSPSSTTSARPSDEPSSVPVALPSRSPTTQVSDVPSLSPSSTTSARPSDEPSSSSVALPSRSPTTLASDQPSTTASNTPSLLPSGELTSSPMALPSRSPTTLASDVPSTTASDTPSVLPSGEPSSSTTIFPSTLPSGAISDSNELEYIGLPPFDGNFRLKACSGDCNSDTDCGFGLICFRRTAFEPVPGCTGTGIRLVDYCYLPPKGHLVVKGVGPNLSLNKCEGMCLDDSDCAGELRCFKRMYLQEVPGCDGLGAVGVDYCYDPRDRDAKPTSSPNLALSPSPSVEETDFLPDSLSLEPSVGVDSSFPSSIPSDVPTSGVDSSFPSSIPSDVPTSGVDSSFPSSIPSDVPTSGVDSAFPSSIPSDVPTNGVDSSFPSSIPSDVPTSGVDSAFPSSVPTVAQSLSDYPSSLPTTVAESSVPSDVPTSGVDSAFPSSVPTVAQSLSDYPSSLPTTVAESSVPSDVPTSGVDSAFPSSVPTVAQSLSDYPSSLPTTVAESSVPSDVPSGVDSTVPSSVPAVAQSSSNSPTLLPTTFRNNQIEDMSDEPSSVPSYAASEPNQLEFIGLPPFNGNARLKACTGECVSDLDCDFGLICFRRSALEPVPGCKGTGKRGVNYCYIPPPGRLVVKDMGPNLSLNNCEGHCSKNSDCVGELQCFKRMYMQEVPGCDGLGAIGTNYCYDPNESTGDEITSASPSSVPTAVVVESLNPTTSYNALSSDPSAGPVSTCNMEPEQRRAALAKMIQTVSSMDALEDPASSQYKALDWIVNDDGLYLCPKNQNVVQRYILALLYFQTNGGSWARCSAGQSDSDSATCEGDTFLSAFHECLWGGVKCDSNETVTALHLDDNNLFGSLPSEMGALSYLAEIDVDNNALVGSIPSSFGNLTRLEVLDCDTNFLTGSLPVELFNATALRVLDLDSNKLTGTLSSQVSRLEKLYFIQLDFNLMSAGVPSELGSLTDLRFLSVIQAGFTEAIPSNLCGKDIEILADCSICMIEGCCSSCLEN